MLGNDADKGNNLDKLVITAMSIEEKKESGIRNDIDVGNDADKGNNLDKLVITAMSIEEKEESGIRDDIDVDDKREIENIKTREPLSEKAGTQYSDE
eukprot:CAMPEP_0113315352 /NCGR_PEP_ID=MMETSP0010_2-20120614/11057_1 /TAXON_ID=216773 ORGANISM="Corethron hystrix, Strain 308" /NCGR_SAMPLE_ID=MMETSP0010_2 /ASSEMBLY_ACC=CAM_ASM_000155 /LENGTH=96 /DNA_ID=CAMNT_0000171841 /DNA_START=1 /DNA_END=288 /DNA_ORIENTATION=- /assembly_acc=CAM_ASM_000155